MDDERDLVEKYKRKQKACPTTTTRTASSSYFLYSNQCFFTPFIIKYFKEAESPLEVQEGGL